MKLKYYLRGMGVGILFATIVLFISYSLRYNREGIIREARKLGMEMTSKNGSTPAIEDEKDTDSTDDATEDVNSGLEGDGSSGAEGSAGNGAGNNGKEDSGLS